MQSGCNPRRPPIDFVRAAAAPEVELASPAATTSCGARTTRVIPPVGRAAEPPTRPLANHHQQSPHEPFQQARPPGHLRQLTNGFTGSNKDQLSERGFTSEISGRTAGRERTCPRTCDLNAWCHIVERSEDRLKSPRLTIQITLTNLEFDTAALSCPSAKPADNSMLPGRRHPDQASWGQPSSATGCGSISRRPWLSSGNT